MFTSCRNFPAFAAEPNTKGNRRTVQCSNIRSQITAGMLLICGFFSPSTRDGKGVHRGLNCVKKANMGSQMHDAQVLKVGTFSSQLRKSKKCGLFSEAIDHANIRLPLFCFIGNSGRCAAKKWIAIGGQSRGRMRRRPTDLGPQPPMTVEEIFHATANVVRKAIAEW